MGNRKQLLATVRQGNYAHAGEEEAIELAMAFIPKNPNHLLQNNYISIYLFIYVMQII